MMKGCRSTKRNLVAFLSGEVDEQTRQRVERHLERCSACRVEQEFLRKTMTRADEMRPELDRVLASIDWEDVAERTVESVWEKAHPRPVSSTREKPAFVLLRLRPILAGLLVGILLGGGAAWLVFRGGIPGKKGAEPFFASSEFLDQVDLEIARRETLDYLEKSQLVLLEIAQTKATDGKIQLNEAARQKARELLSKKKFLNPQLEKAPMVKAKEICDQIELLFHELSSLSEGLTEMERQELQSLIEDRSLLLKIRLLKKELQKSEV